MDMNTASLYDSNWNSWDWVEPTGPHRRGDEYYDLCPLSARQIVINNLNIQMDSSKMDTHT